MATRIAGASTVPVVTGTVSITMATHQAGDLLIIAIGGKYNATTGAFSTSPVDSGFTQVAFVSGGTVTTGNDAGDSFLGIYAKVATSAAETAGVISGGLAPNSWWMICESFRPDSGKVWTDAAALASIPSISANDTTAATPLTGTGTFSPQPVAAQGAMLVAFGAFPSDLGSSIGAVVLSNGGLTGGATAALTYVENALGADSGGASWLYTGFTGTASGATTMSVTIVSLSNNYGPLVAMWLRETAAPGSPPDLTRQRRIQQLVRR